MNETFDADKNAAKIARTKMLINSVQQTIDKVTKIDQDFAQKIVDAQTLTKAKYYHNKIEKNAKNVASAKMEIANLNRYLQMLEAKEEQHIVPEIK